MAIAFVTANKGNAGSGGTTVTVSITAGAGSNRFLYASAGWNNPNTATVSSITYNGGADFKANLIGTPSSTNFKLSQFYLKDADLTSGAVNVVITMSASTEIHLGVAVYTGVDQTTPYSNVTSQVDNGGDLTDPTITVTSTSDGMVCDGWISGGGAYTVGSGQTQDWNELGFDYRHGGSHEAGTGAGVVMDWTNTGNNAHVIQGFNLNAASGGGGSIGGPIFDGRTFRGLTNGRVLSAPRFREARMWREAARLHRRNQQLRRAA